MEKIIRVLNEDIRPILNQDGGDIEIIGYAEEEKLLRLRLRGQCSTCPLARPMTEPFIRQMIEEKTGVTNISIETGLSEEMLALAKKILNGGGTC